MKKMKWIFAVLACLLMFSPAMADGFSMPSSRVGDYANWLDESVRERFALNLSEDYERFYQAYAERSGNPNNVPTEAKIARSLMAALSKLGGFMQHSLYGFVIIFIISMFALWLALEAWYLISTSGNTKKLTQDVVKKSLWVAFWIAILRQDPAWLFMQMAAPITALGGEISNLITSAMTSGQAVDLVAGCDAIRAYSVVNASDLTMLDAKGAGDMLCMTSSMSSVFRDGVTMGLKWFGRGLSTLSLITILAGGAFVFMFVRMIWKFAIMGWNIIADIFMAVLMLPFAAIAQTIGAGETSDKGVAGELFKKFAGMFGKSASLPALFIKVINAAVYMAVLSVIMGICALLLGGIDLSGSASPIFNSEKFVIVLTMAALVMHLAEKAQKYAEEIGVKLENDLGEKVGKDIQGVWKYGKDQAKDWWKIIVKKK